MGFKPWVNQSSYTATATFNKAIFTQLLNLKRDFSISPGIFKNWKWNSEEMSYIFEVDTSLEFDKKRRVELKDIEFAILKSFLIPTDISRHQFLMDIDCKKPLKVGMTFSSGMCSGLKLIKPNKVSLKLKRNNPTFLYRLGELMPPVAPIEDFKDDMQTFKNVPRGTGKYYVSFSDEKTSKVILTLKKKYKNKPEFQKAPTKIYFFNHGDALTNKADLTTNAGNFALHGNKSYSYTIGQVPKVINVLDFNYLNKYGKNKLFRKAVALAIDRSKLLGSSGKLIAATGLVPSSYTGYQHTPFEYNPSKSKEIVTAHFSKISSLTKPLKAFYHGPENSPKKRYIKALEKNLRTVGLYFDFKPSTHIDFDKTTKNKVFYIYGLVTSFVDPLSPFMNYSNKGHRFYNHDREDKIPEKIFDRARSAPDKEAQARIIQELSNYYRENYTQLPLQEAFPSFRSNKKIESIGIDDVFYTLDLSKIKMKVD